MIGGKYNLELTVAHLKQVGLVGGEDYDKNRDLAVSIPSLSGDAALAENYFEDMPWLVEKELTEGIDKSAAVKPEEVRQSQAQEMALKLD